MSAADEARDDTPKPEALPVPVDGVARTPEAWRAAVAAGRVHPGWLTLLPHDGKPGRYAPPNEWEIKTDAK